MRMIRLFLFISIWLCSFQNLNGQNADIDSMEAKAWNVVFDDLDSTISIFNKILTICDNKKDTFYTTRTYLNKGQAYLYHKKFKQSYENLLQADEVFNKIHEHQNKSQLENEIQFNFGCYFSNINDQLTSEKYFISYIRNIKKKKNLNATDSSLLISAYQFISAIDEAKGNHKASFDFVKFNIDYQTRLHQDSSHSSVLGQICNLASYQTKNGDFENAIINFQKCIPSIQKDVEAARALKKHHADYLIQFYQKLAYCQLALGKTELAISLLEESYNYETTTLEPHAKSDMNLGHAYGKVKQFNKADAYFNSAIKKIKSVYIHKSPYRAEIYLGRADYYAKREMIDEALKDYQTALIELQPEFNNTNPFKNPDYADLKISDLLLTTLRKKSQLLSIKSKTDADRNTLHAAYETATLGVRLMTKSINQLTINEDDIIGIVHKNYGLYEEVLSAGFESNIASKLELFKILDQSKSTSLLKNIQRKNELNYGKVPQDLSNYYHLAKLELTRLETERYKLTETTAINSINLKIFNQKETVKNLKMRIDAILQEDIQQKKEITVASIQSNFLDEDQAILEYFVGENSSFVFLIKKDTVYFEKLNLSKTDLEAAAILKDKIYEGADYKSPNDFYISNAFQLYKTLIQPLDSMYELPKKLIIIPDGPLNYLPFEALLTSFPEEGAEYEDYDYLIREKQISYCFSSTMLEELKNQHSASENIRSSVLAFAPLFKNTGNKSRSIEDERGGLNELQHNVSEVEKIANWFNCKYIVGENATKAQFSNLAREYRIIHLATHAKVNYKYPEWSYTAFSNVKDTVNYELPCIDLSNESKLNADLVVLSACETGVGESHKGEGIISISRSYIEAGSKSILTTLWNIDDRSSATVMGNFYQHLSKENTTKDEALRQAKIDYLAIPKPNNRNHPKYWAAFVPYGDMSPIDPSMKRSWTPHFLFGSGVGLIFMFFIWRQKKAKNQNYQEVQNQ